MSARFSFAIAEAQQKIQDEAFMDKMGIGDYMTVLASGLKEGLQEKERRDFEREKIKKAEEAALRKKQEAADKLAKEIDATVNLIITTNGLDPAKAAGLGLTKILKDNGSANASILQGYIDSIDNIQDYTIGGPPVAVDDQMNMIINPPVFKNPNIKDVAGMDLTTVVSELDKVTKQSNPERYTALINRQATLQSGKGTYKDETFYSKLTRENIGQAEIMLDGLLETEQIDLVGYRRILKGVNQLRKLEQYQDLSNNDPFRKKNGDLKSITEIEQMLRDPENNTLTQVQRDRGLGLITPISQKKPVEELSVTQVISERELLKGQAKKTDEETLRLAALDSAYDALVAAGKINPKEEEVFDVVAHVAGMDADEQRDTLLLLQEKQRQGTLEPTEQQTLAKLEFLTKVDGEFTNLDKRVFKDYSYTASDKATLNVTIENVEERLANYIKDKSSLSPDRFEAYTNELVRLKIIKDAFDLQDKVKENDVSVKLTNEYTTIKLKNDTGVTDVRLTDKGNFYIISGPRAGQVIERTDTEGYQVDSVGPTTSQVEALSKLINRNDDFFSELTDLKNDSAKLVQSSYELTQFVGRNEGVLTIGAAASFVDSVLKGTEQLFLTMSNTNSLLSEQQVIEQAKKAALEQFEEAAKDDASLQGLASVYNQFLSLSLRHAFQFAKLDLGSSGQALSNFDFKNALRINNTGADYATYVTNILNQTLALIQNASNRFDDKLTSDAEHNAALNSKLYKDNFEQTGIKLGGVREFLVKNNKEAYQVFKDWEDSNGTKLPPRPQPTVRNSNIPPTQLNEIANAQEAADQMNRLNADGKYTAFVRDPANAGKMATTASLLAKLVYRTNQPTPEMITHATNWLKTLQEE